MGEKGIRQFCQESEYNISFSLKIYYTSVTLELLNTLSQIPNLIKKLNLKFAENQNPILRVRLVDMFKYMFSIFKQHYTNFHTIFHPQVFLKNTNNATRTIIPNDP